MTKNYKIVIVFQVKFHKFMYVLAAKQPNAEIVVKIATNLFMNYNKSFQKTNQKTFWNRLLTMNLDTIFHVLALVQWKEEYDYFCYPYTKYQRSNFKMKTQRFWNVCMDAKANFNVISRASFSNWKIDTILFLDIR